MSADKRTRPWTVYLLIITAAYGLWRRRTWAWHGALLAGLAVICWITVEILVIGYHPPPLQPFYALLGVVSILLAWLPSARRHYGRM